MKTKPIILLRAGQYAETYKMPMTCTVNGKPFNVIGFTPVPNEKSDKRYQNIVTYINDNAIVDCDTCDDSWLHVNKVAELNGMKNTFVMNEKVVASC